jgi:hypothetical protein
MPEFCPVEKTILEKDGPTEAILYRRMRRSTRFNDSACNDIRIGDSDTEIGEQIGDSRFAASDSAGESYYICWHCLY